MDIISVLEELSKIVKNGYGEGIPNNYDYAVIKLTRHYMQADERERKIIRSYTKDELRLALLGFSDRLSILAHRTKDKILLESALVVHSIEDFKYDKRENIFRLALINHVAGKLDVNVSNLFDKVARLSSSSSAEELLNFNKRPKELKDLNTMKIEEIETDEGIDYRYFE